MDENRYRVSVRRNATAVIVVLAGLELFQNTDQGPSHESGMFHRKAMFQNP